MPFGIGLARTLNKMYGPACKNCANKVGMIAKVSLHLVECLEMKMTPFTSQRCRPSIPLIEEVRVYCTCSLSDSGEEEMAACDKCSEWYHSSCESIPTEGQIWDAHTSCINLATGPKARAVDTSVGVAQLSDNVECPRIDWLLYTYHFTVMYSNCLIQ